MMQFLFLLFFVNAFNHVSYKTSFARRSFTLYFILQSPR